MLDDFLTACVCTLLAAGLFAVTGTLFDADPPRPAEPRAEAIVTLPTVVVTGKRLPPPDAERLAEVR